VNKLGMTEAICDRFSSDGIPGTAQQPQSLKDIHFQVFISIECRNQLLQKAPTIMNLKEIATVKS
jgi:hypothetical protein